MISDHHGWATSLDSRYVGTSVNFHHKHYAVVNLLWVLEFRELPIIPTLQSNSIEFFQHHYIRVLCSSMLVMKLFDRASIDTVSNAAVTWHLSFWSNLFLGPATYLCTCFTSDYLGDHTSMIGRGSAYLAWADVDIEIITSTWTVNMQSIDLYNRSRWFNHVRYLKPGLKKWWT